MRLLIYLLALMSGFPLLTLRVRMSRILQVSRNRQLLLSMSWLSRSKQLLRAQPLFGHAN